MNLRTKILLTALGMTLVGLLSVGIVTSWQIRSSIEKSVPETTAVGSIVSEVQIAIVLVGILMTVAVTVISLRFARKLTAPLLMVSRTAQAITRGEVEERVQYISKDEIGELSIALNRMAEKLGSEIKKLKKLELVRSEFLGNVSHELRTPIFSIQGFLETLLDGAVDDPAVNREFLGKAYRHADRLNALLNDLIEISRIESGEMKMSFRYFPIVGFVRQTMEEMRAEAEKKRITVTCASEADDRDEVYGDKERLKQVMINLIDNAIKYTEPGGTITLQVRPARGKCEITVEDTGSGIPAEHIPRIFERFYRVDRDRSREVGGTGLGLAIVKHIVEAHEGTIQAESVVGKGSRFTFSLKR
ncbi:MAG: sensor histidine kinase [Bacteroidota bacterium]